MNVTWIPAAALPLALLASGCERGEAVKAAETARPAPVPVRPPVVTGSSLLDPSPLPIVTAPTRPPGPPGPVYFIVNATGVVRLDGGNFTMVAELPDQPIRDLQLGGDGAVWVLGGEDLLRSEGDTFKTITHADAKEIGDSLAAIEHFVVTAEGHVWATTLRSIAHFDGQRWTHEAWQTISPDGGILNGIAVDRGGRVMVASTMGVHVRADGRWQAMPGIEEVMQNRSFFTTVTLAPDNSVYMLTTRGLLRMDSAVDPVMEVVLGGPSRASYDSLDVSGNGSLGVRLNGRNAILVPAGAGPRVFEGPGDEDLYREVIRTIAADDSGRLWIASDRGIDVLGPGDAKTSWPRASVLELVGDIDDMLVIGSGPAILPAAGPVRTGGLTGKVLVNGIREAGIDVAVCPGASMLFADSPLKFAGKVDADGVWTLSDVPLGPFGFAVKLDGVWQTPARFPRGMKEGQVFDTGTLKLRRE